MRSTKQILNANSTIAQFREAAVKCFGEEAVAKGLQRHQLGYIKYTHNVSIPAAIWKTKQGEGRGLLFFIPNEIDADEGNASSDAFSKAIFLTFGNNYNGILSKPDLKLMQDVLGKKSFKVPSAFWAAKTGDRGLRSWPIDVSEFEGVPAGEHQQIRKEKKVKAEKKEKPEAKARSVVKKAKEAAKKGDKKVKSVTRKASTKTKPEAEKAADAPKATRRKVVVVA